MDIWEIVKAWGVMVVVAIAMWLVGACSIAVAGDAPEVMRAGSREACYSLAEMAAYARSLQRHNVPAASARLIIADIWQIEQQPAAGWLKPVMDLAYGKPDGHLPGELGSIVNMRCVTSAGDIMVALFGAES